MHSRHVTAMEAKTRVIAQHPPRTRHMAPAEATFSPKVAMPDASVTTLRIQDDSVLSPSSQASQQRQSPLPTRPHPRTLGPRPPAMASSDEGTTSPASSPHFARPMSNGDFRGDVDKISSDRFIAPDPGLDNDDNVLAVDEGFCEGQSHEDTSWADATLALWKANAAAGNARMKGVGPAALAWNGVVKNRPRMCKRPRMRRQHLGGDNLLHHPGLGMAS
jgi:hypothetical protein